MNTQRRAVKKVGNFCSLVLIVSSSDSMNHLNVNFSCCGPSGFCVMVESFIDSMPVCF